MDLLKKILEYKKGSEIPKKVYFETSKEDENFNIFFRGDVGEKNSFTIDKVSKINVNSDANSGFIESIAHRGYSAIYPENTARAFIEAHRIGFRSVEMDIQLTADNQFVVIHDNTVERTSDGMGIVREMTLAQLKQLDFGSWKNVEYSGEKILTFEEFIQLCSQIGLRPYVDIKNGLSYLKEVADIVKKYQMEDYVSFMSYDVPNLKTISSFLPKAKLCLNLDELTEERVLKALNLLTEDNKVVLNVRVSALNEDAIAMAKEANLPLQIWTVDNIDVIKNIDPYITAILSNRWVAGEIIHDKVMNADE